MICAVGDIGVTVLVKSSFAALVRMGQVLWVTLV
jgi:hypothetical protein